MINLMQVVIFSTSTCPYCVQLKEYLTAKGVAFSEKVIDQNEEAKKELEAESGGFLGVPFVLVAKDDGTKEKIVGFDKGKLETIIQGTTSGQSTTGSTS